MRLRDESRLKKKLKNLGPKNPIWTAIQGDGGGTVDIPGHKSLWYVRPTGMDLPVVVRRGNATIVEGAPVWVGRDIYQKKVVRVLDMQENGEIGGGTTSLPDHAENHYEDSVDPVFITTKQITDELVYISGALEITVNPGWVKVNGLMVQVQQTVIDVTSNIPVSGAQYTLVRADSTGAVDLQDGTPVDYFVDLTDADIPACADDYVLLGILRLYTGQTELSKTVGASDLIDARFIPSGGSSDTTFQNPVTIDTVTAEALIIGNGETNIDYYIRFNGESSDGLLAWMEDEDRFQLLDDVQMLYGLIVNELGHADGDFRAESDTEENMILLDASADLLYLGGISGVVIEKGGMYSLNMVSLDDEAVFHNDEAVFL